MADEDLWRRRFQLFMALRLLGVLLFLIGVAVAFSDLARKGGWPELGGVLAVVGALEAVLVAKVLKKHWEREDR